MSVLLFLLGLGLTPAPTPSPSAITWPTKAWPESNPAAEGLDAAPLEALDRDLAAGKYGYVDSMLVIRHGRVVYDKTYDHAADYRRLFGAKGGDPGMYDYYDPDWHPYYKESKL